MKRARLLALVTGGVLLAGVSVKAASGPRQATIQERARGAARVVVATVVETTARYERNSYGDELIVTDARLAVEEAIKGSADSVVMTVEGGTVAGITLRVSDLPSVRRGERGVFFLTAGTNGEFRPHLRGEGILKLDSNNHVRGTNLTLDDVRRQARAEAK